MELTRRLGLTDAVVIGLGSMIGAGVFAVFGPAAAAAGSGLLVALVIAGLVAYCNAMSSAWLAARYPESGGTYVYGRERLGPFWGYLAGWGFVVGKTASCAAMALTFGAYAGYPKLFAVAGVVALTTLNLFGVQKSVLLTKIIVTITLLGLGTVVAVAPHDADFGAIKAGGVLQAAGLIFFAFAGYARIATLGEEVRDPERTIPRAIPLALGIVLAVYAVVAFTALSAVGADVLASSSAPLVSVAPQLAAVIRVSACLAALGSLLGLILGVSRTVLAMARDRHLPPVLARVHAGVPRHAELAVGLVVIALVLLVDLRGAIGFSSFCVLTYYAVANASAWSLGKRVVPAFGLAGCVVLAFSLPIASVIGGVVVLALGTAAWFTRKVLWSRSR
ncbi:amino acid transporter [Lentzea sp. NBRC 105346]|uniref:APC family permease n=1 Tax=Lentzea sp. NBRC 105346 TaxID=3032205 RepID=UPI0025536929|nr:APC family permease [Lentzea sp. NBRC 105346]GLZ33904.1 amino acid transporter [Lentzea sp. NBRC 105346]